MIAEPAAKRDRDRGNQRRGPGWLLRQIIDDDAGFRHRIPRPDIAHTGNLPLASRQEGDSCGQSVDESTIWLEDHFGIIERDSAFHAKAASGW